MISARKSVDSSSADPVCKEKCRPCNGKEVGANGFHGKKLQEWISEECKEDVCSAVNNKLNEIEVQLQKEKFRSMECKVSGISNRVRPDKVDEIKDSLMYFSTCKACGISSCGINLDSGWSGWWRCGCSKTTWRGFIHIPTGFGWIQGVRLAKDNIFVMFMGFWVAPCMRSGFGVLMRCFDDRFVILGPLILVKELSVGRNANGILWFGTGHMLQSVSPQFQH